MAVSDYDEKTRITQVVQNPLVDEGTGNDCVVVIYTKESGLLGKRFVLERNPVRVGRGADNAVVLEGDSVSRRHAHFESRGPTWFIEDDNSTNETITIDLENPPWATSVVFTFGLYDAGNDWWWAIDNIKVTGMPK